jgi:hypothetical protein
MVSGMEACAECGYSYRSLRREEIGPELRAQARRYGDVLDGVDSDGLRAHPRVEV